MQKSRNSWLQFHNSGTLQFRLLSHYFWAQDVAYRKFTQNKTFFSVALPGLIFLKKSYLVTCMDRQKRGCNLSTRIISFLRQARFKLFDNWAWPYWYCLIWYCWIFQLQDEWKLYNWTAALWMDCNAGIGRTRSYLGLPWLCTFQCNCL